MASPMPELIANWMLSVLWRVSGPIVDFFLSSLHNPMSAGRRDAVAGNWKGMVHQEPGPDIEAAEYPAALEVKAGRKTVSGKLVTFPKINNIPKTRHFTISGGFLYDRFLQLNYISDDRGAIHFGSVILKLSSSGDELKDGRFIGHGKSSEEILRGTADAQKTSLNFDDLLLQIERERQPPDYAASGGR